MADRLLVFDAQVGFLAEFQLRVMGSLIVTILATMHATMHIAPAVLPMLLAVVALAALAAGLMGLLARSRGNRAGGRATSAAVELAPQRDFVVANEPSFRSLIGRRAAAPSRAPPSRRHQFRLTVPWVSLLAAAPAAPLGRRDSSHGVELLAPPLRR